MVLCRLSRIRLRRHKRLLAAVEVNKTLLKQKLSSRFVIKFDGSLESLRLANTTAQVLESLQAAMK